MKSCLIEKGQQKTTEYILSTGNSHVCRHTYTRVWQIESVYGKESCSHKQRTWHFIMIKAIKVVWLLFWNMSNDMKGIRKYLAYVRNTLGNDTYVWIYYLINGGSVWGEESDNLVATTAGINLDVDHWKPCDQNRRTIITLCSHESSQNIDSPHTHASRERPLPKYVLRRGLVATIPKLLDS